MSQGMQFDEMSELTDREIQMTLREVDTRDLAIALLGSGKKLQDRIFGNMSERAGDMIREEIEGRKGTDANEIKAMRDRVLKTIQQLVEAGHILWPKAKEEGGTPTKKHAYEPIAPEVEKAIRTSLAQLSFDDIVAMYVGLAGVARREGILALERLVSIANREDGMLVQGLELAVDGTEPQLIQSILDCRASGLLRNLKMKYRVICDGVMSLHSGDHPALIEMKLRNITLSKGGHAQQESEDALRKSLAERPCSQRDADGIREMIVGMAHIARNAGGLAPLAAFVDLVDEPLMALGLRLAVDRSQAEVTRSILRVRMLGLLHEFETKYIMAAAGIRLIQGGTKEEAVAAYLRCFYKK